MPKKYQSRALLTKPASSAPSTLASSRAPASSSHGAPSRPSVNELIRESRKAKSDVKHKIDATTLASLPPSLRAVLNMPPPATPQPRTQLRGPARLRRIPGPPPPQSWLKQSQHASDDSRSTFSQLRWLRARIQQQSSTLPGSEHFPSTTSLEHLALKTIATNWQWHSEYDNTYLSTLPVTTRMTLLSYLAVYNEAHWPNPFPLLFPPECEQDELNAVNRLDLANSLGSWATVKKIEKELVMAYRESTTQMAGKHKTITGSSEVVPESWDDEDEMSTAGMPSSMQTYARFGNLTHLSLAVNPASSAAPASWSALISLSGHLSRLTSLSLAHWPAPTYTPNAAQGRTKIVNTTMPNVPTQVYGGSNMYTSFDNDWREASGILRSLSRNLYCLTWLDLSGCAPWLAALTWKDEEDEYLGVDFNGSWRNLGTLILAVGWLPGRPPSIEDDLSSTTRSTSSIDSTRAIEQLYGGQQAIRDALESIANIRIGNARPRQPPDQTVTPLWNVEVEREKQYFRKDVERYITQQKNAKNIAEEIKVVRRKGGGKWIDFEYGELLNVEALMLD